MVNTGLVALCFLTAVAGCGKKEGDQPAAADKMATGDKPAAGDPPAKPAAPALPVNKGTPNKDKDMLNLELAPMGNWKPEWDVDAKVAKWSNEEYMTGIVIRIVKDKLDSIDDLKSEAPMMMQLGTAITKVVEEKPTPMGWYAIVESDEGKNTTMVYIQKYEGGTQIVCSGNLTPRKDPTSAGGITKDEVTKACESIKAKA